MTIEGIIRMAKQAGFADEEIDYCQQIFIHFAMLVAEHERNEIIQILDDSTGYVQMDAIRDRGQHENV
jgi:hypothetical protein